MDIRKLQRAIVDGLEDIKAQDIQVFNTEHLSPLFERVIIASGQSNRQTKALASSVRDAVKARGMSILRVEGEENGEWIIVDCGAAVILLWRTRSIVAIALHPCNSAADGVGTKQELSSASSPPTVH